MPSVVVRRPRVGGALGAPSASREMGGRLSSMSQLGGSRITYVFPFAPVEITLDNVGSEYVEVSRPGDFAIVDRKEPKLLRASFQFRIADRASGGLADVEDDLRTLRLMAHEDIPVSFSGMTGMLLSDDARLSGQTKGVSWRITDMSITTVRLTPTNTVSQADCRITVTEDRNPKIALVTLDKITYDETPPKASEPATKSSKKAAPSNSNSGGGGVTSTAAYNQGKNDNRGKEVRTKPSPNPRALPKVVRT